MELFEIVYMKLESMGFDIVPIMHDSYLYHVFDENKENIGFIETNENGFVIDTSAIIDDLLRLGR